MSATRLDVQLVQRGLARSRQHAGVLIREGHVELDGAVVRKSATSCGEDSAINIVGDPLQYASRGAFKLAGALDYFSDIAVAGRVALDAGASTGGFTDILLERDAALVYAFDVGTDQLLPRLQNHERVVARMRTNVRHLTAGDLDPAPELVVADLSFISLTLVVPALVAVSAPGADLLLMVKPQFEVGKGRIGSTGVVRDPHARADAVCGVLTAARAAGYFPAGVRRSDLPGPAGNVEYFTWLRDTESWPSAQDAQRVLAEIDREEVTS